MNCTTDFIGINSTIVTSTRITMLFANGEYKNVMVSEDDTVRVLYLNKDKLVECTGKVIKVSTEGRADTTTLKVDCSREYNSDIKLISILNIRDIQVNEYIATPL